MIAVGFDSARGISALPRDTHVIRRLKIIPAHIDAGGSERGFQGFHRGIFCELDPNGKTVAVKYRGLHQPQGRHWNSIFARQ